MKTSTTQREPVTWCGVTSLEVWLKLARCATRMHNSRAHHDSCKLRIFKHNNVHFWWVVYVHWNVLWLLEKKSKQIIYYWSKSMKRFLTSQLYVRVSLFWYNKYTSFTQWPLWFDFNTIHFISNTKELWLSSKSITSTAPYNVNNI